MSCVATQAELPTEPAYAVVPHSCEASPAVRRTRLLHGMALDASRRQNLSDSMSRDAGCDDAGSGGVLG